MSGTPTLIILAGGASSRMWPLREKSLLCFGAEPLLLSQLRTYESLGFTDVVIVGNSQNEAEIHGLIDRLEDRIRIKFAVQPDAKGMGDALLRAAEVLPADTSAVYINQVHDIVEERLHVDMLNMYRSNPHTTYLAGMEMQEYFPGGYLIIDDTGMISCIMEKPGPD
jgi:dTDP-glucose pyrophosphorylase